MSRFIYLNGQYIPHDQAHVHVEDRAFLMGDAVYEVIGYIHGHMADETGHLDRLERSLSELKMKMPLERENFRFILREIVRKNRQKNAAIYIQVTRGVAKRDFKFPKADTPQNILIISYNFDFDGNKAVEEGIKIKTVPDIRWKRRDIKTTLLFPQSYSKMIGVEDGYDDVFMVDDEGYVTEASASNAWIVTKENKIVTRALSHDILRGITRTAIEKLCDDNKYELEERSFTPEEAYEAKEAFTTSATSLIMPVINIDEHQIGDGKRGNLTRKLYQEYRDYVEGLRGEQVHWEAGL